MINKISRLLSPAFKQGIRRSYQRISLFVAQLFVKSRAGAVVYYALFRPGFGREQQAVLAGILRHQQEQAEPGFSSAQLRRNIHRLEKGLIMRPRKAVFALDYIQQTIDLYERCSQTSGFSSDELCWAHAVLTRYFSVVTADPMVHQLKQRFDLIVAPPRTQPDSIALSPYPAGPQTLPEVSAEQVWTLMQMRHSVRWFQPTPVATQLIEQAVNMAATAPSACNRQPFFLKATNDPTIAAKLAAIPMGTVGFAGNIPALAVVVGDLSCYEAERDRHVIYIDGSLFAMQFMLACQSLGLATCPINWPDVEALERMMQNALGLQLYQRPVMLIAVGYADPTGEIPASLKKNASQLLHWINEN